MNAHLIITYLIITIVYCSNNPIQIVEIDINTLDTNLSELVSLHHKRLKQYECFNPLPMVINSNELLNEIKNDYIIRPHSTVLMRCGPTTGCCKNQFLECQSIEDSNVTLVFQVKSIENRLSPSEYRAISVTNHTRCGCVLRQIHSGNEDD